MKDKKEKYKNTDRLCIECHRQLDKRTARAPWKSEIIKAKDEWINKLLEACEYLSKEYAQIHGEGSLPGFVDVALSYPDSEKPT